MLIKATFKDLIRVEWIRKYDLKCNLYLQFWYNKSCWFPVTKYWCHQNLRDASHDLYDFCIFLRFGITVTNFIIVKYVQQILGRVAFLFPPSNRTPERPILKRVQSCFIVHFLIIDFCWTWKYLGITLALWKYFFTCHFFTVVSVW